jgi:hypothetical protein
MSEAHMWSRIRDDVFKGKGFHVERVENKASLGTPDVSWAGGGKEGWIELKWVARWPVKGGPLALDHFTPQQRLWLTKRCLAGGRADVLLGVGSDDFLLFSGATAARVLGKLEYSALLSLCKTSILGGLDSNKLLEGILA